MGESAARPAIASHLPTSIPACPCPNRGRVAIVAPAADGTDAHRGRARRAARSRARPRAGRTPAPRPPGPPPRRAPARGHAARRERARRGHLRRHLRRRPAPARGDPRLRRRRRGHHGVGFNLLRLPISWSALEPARGRFDAAYLDRIAGVLALCRSHGILVLLDFHQDAFSKEIGEDGAPRWVLDLLLGAGNYPYLGGPLDDLQARRFAPATLEAFRQFFRNTAGAQDELAAAAAV